VARRRLHAELERRPEDFDQPAPATVENILPEQAAPSIESPHERLIALQRGAGNAATGQLMRRNPGRASLAREPAGSAPSAAFSPIKPPDIFNLPPDPLVQESNFLHGFIVPNLLDRLLVAPDRIGTRESLAEVALLAREELERHLTKTAPPGTVGPVRAVSSVGAIQSAVIAVARRQNVIVPGHRPADDKGGLESEAKALGNLAGVKFPDLAIEASAGGFKFRFDGQLSASGKVGGTEVQGKVGPDGAEAKVGPVTSGGSIGKDSAKVELKVVSGPVELKGDIEAKAGKPTTWSAGLEFKFAGGAAPVPDAAAMASTIQSVGHDLVEAATYMGDAVAGAAKVDKTAIEQKLKPAKESIEKIAGYIENSKTKPAGGPGATLGVTAKGSETGAVSAQLTLTITFY